MTDTTLKSDGNTKVQRAIAALAYRRDKLQDRINAEMKKRVPCAFTLTRLKKTRLWAKDRIAMLRAQVRQRGHNDMVEG